MSHCAEHQKSGFHNKLNPKYRPCWFIFPPTNAPRDPNGRPGAECSRQRTCISSLVAVFWTRSPRRAWSTKPRLTLSVGGNGGNSWQKINESTPPSRSCRHHNADRRCASPRARLWGGPRTRSLTRAWSLKVGFRCCHIASTRSTLLYFF